MPVRVTLSTSPLWDKGLTKSPFGRSRRSINLPALALRPDGILLENWTSCMTHVLLQHFNRCPCARCLLLPWLIFSLVFMAWFDYIKQANGVVYHFSDSPLPGVQSLQSEHPLPKPRACDTWRSCCWRRDSGATSSGFWSQVSLDEQLR